MHNDRFKNSDELWKESPNSDGQQYHRYQNK